MPTYGVLLVWFVGFAVMVFGIPFVAADLVELQHDLYYLIYGSLVVLYLAVFASRVGPGWRPAVTHNVGWSIGLGALVAVAAVRNALSDDSTRHPDGLFFVFELVWRGLFYGVIDALALFVFPALVAHLLMRGNRHGVVRKLGFAGLTLSLTLCITTTYHFGYGQFRDGDIADPLTGAVLMSIPAMVTGNPVGALVAHGAVHLTAVAHEYYGNDPGYLPPNLIDYPDRAGGPVALLLAVVWLALVSVTVYTCRRRLFVPTRS